MNTETKKNIIFLLPIIMGLMVIVVVVLTGGDSTTSHGPPAAPSIGVGGRGSALKSNPVGAAGAKANEPPTRPTPIMQILWNTRVLSTASNTRFHYPALLRVQGRNQHE